MITRIKYINLKELKLQLKLHIYTYLDV